MPKPPRLVVDTNIIVSGLITTGTPPAKVLDAVHKKKITDETITHLTALFINETERVEILTPVTASPDPDDDKFLSLAVEGQADFIIAGDKADLLSLKEISGIKVITARQAVEKFKL